MTYINQRFATFFTILIFLIGFAIPTIHPVHADTYQIRYIQIDLTERETELLFESSLVYNDFTYYGVRESANVWRFLIDEEIVDDTLIDLVTLYDESGVPYTFTPASITEMFPVVPDEEEPIDSEGAVATDGVNEPAPETEPVVQEAPGDMPLPLLAIDVGKEAGIDKAVVGGVIPYTFFIENTGSTPIFINSITDDFFSGGMTDRIIEDFNDQVTTSLTDLIGDDGILPGERVEVTHELMIPKDYPRTIHPEIGSVFRVIAIDSYDRVIEAESPQIVLLQDLDFTVMSTSEKSTVHPGEAVMYTYTLINTSNVTLYFADVSLDWSSGALTLEEQRLADERLYKVVRDLPIFDGGFGPGEEIVFSFEQSLLPSYDVRAGSELVNEVTFTLEVNDDARVSRSVETAVAVKQPFPEIETEEPKTEVDQPEVEQQVTEVEQIKFEQRDPKVEQTDMIEQPVTPVQEVLPMTGETENVWRVMLGIVMLALGLVFMINRGQRSNHS